MFKEKIIIEMKEVFKEIPFGIEHTLKVLKNAEDIMKGENIGEEEKEFISIIGILHDIGAVEAQKKYGSIDGVYQEKEGPEVAKEILKKVGYNKNIDRICFIIGNHHTPSKIDGLDFQIQWEADLLENLTVMDKEKEQEKLKLLYDIYEQPMYRIAYAILHHTEQAEDAVSDAFLRILKKLKKIGDVRSEKTKHYIISIIRSTAINQYRQNQRDSERYTVWDDRILQVPNQKDDIEQLLANIAQEESIAELLEPLNDLDRQIVLMRCEEELSFREIAERLSMKEAAARKRFERARKAIQQKKGELYDEIRTQLFSV